MARSPYFEAKINRWCDEKKELVIDDCDIPTFNIIVDYIYGGALPASLKPIAYNRPLTGRIFPQTRKEVLNQVRAAAIKKDEGLWKLLKVSDKLQMMDLKKEIEEVLIETVDNWPPGSSMPCMRFLKVAERYDCERLLMVCARKTTVKSKLLQKNVCAELIKEVPKFTAALLVAFREQATQTYPPL